MAIEGKTIDQITRTLTSFAGTEYIPGRDGTGDFKAAVSSLVDYATSLEEVYEIDDDDYTMSDSDYYKLYTFDNLTANHAFNLPTLADNQNKTFFICNLDGGYDIEITPEGAENINDWNYMFPITEKYGIVKVSALSDRWLIEPVGDACIYEISVEVSDSGLALDGSWDDVAGVSLTLPSNGVGDCSAFGFHVIVDTSLPSYLYGYFGLGVTAGNNAPDVRDGEAQGFRVIADTAYGVQMKQFIPAFRLTASGQTLLMKARVTSDELNVTTHTMYADSLLPMYIKWIRKY